MHRDQVNGDVVWTGRVSPGIDVHNCLASAHGGASVFVCTRACEHSIKTAGQHDPAQTMPVQTTPRP